MKKNCLVIAGEKSGEEHFLSFCNEMKKLDQSITFFGVGGDELEKEGMELIYHLNDFSSFGFSEVILKIPFYKKALDKIEEEVTNRNCKYAILIDFQGFNHRLAKRLKKKQIKVFYYVAPQAWAWKAWRAKELAEYVDTLFTIIPFEKKWFQERGVKRVYSVPHPLLINYKDKLRDLLPPRSFQDISLELRILLLPGSRNFEVKNLLPEFINMIKSIKEDGSINRKIHVSIVQCKSVHQHLYLPFNEQFDAIYENEELDLALQKSDVAVAASGTVTLACALFEVPTIVTYKSSLLNEYIYNTFLSYTGYISLANIVHQDELFPELIGDDANSYDIKKALELITSNELSYNNLTKKLKKTVEILSGESFDIASYITSQMNKA